MVKMGQFLNTSEAQAVTGASEITGDLASDFIESKTNWGFLISHAILCGLQFLLWNLQTTVKMEQRCAFTTYCA